MPHFKRKPLGKIGPPQMRAYVEHLRDKRKLSASSIRKYVAPLRAMFAELVEDGVLPTNPASVRIIGTPDRQPRRQTALSPKTIETLVAEMPVALRDLILLLALTGLRVSEACGLQWGDLTHDERGAPVLRIERQYRNGRYKPKTKTAAGFRTLELAAPLARRLLKRRAELGRVALRAPIFATRTGTPYDDHNVRRALRDAADRVGVERATPHMLRHSIASLLYERGWTDVQVAALLGHEDPELHALALSARRRARRRLGARQRALDRRRACRWLCRVTPGSRNTPKLLETERHARCAKSAHLQRVSQTTRERPKRSEELVMKRSAVRVRSEALGLRLDSPQTSVLGRGRRAPAGARRHGRSRQGLVV